MQTFEIQNFNYIMLIFQRALFTIKTLEVDLPETYFTTQVGALENLFRMKIMKIPSEVINKLIVITTRLYTMFTMYIVYTMVYSS